MEASVADIAAPYGASEEAAWSWMKIGIIGLATAAMIVYPLWPDSETPMAVYQREAAPRDACKAAALATAAFRAMSGLTFVDDCDAPTVTEVLNEPGHFIVTLDLEEQGDGLRDGRRTYSVLLDGRGFDKWRILDVKLAPNTLTLDASQVTADYPLSSARGTPLPRPTDVSLRPVLHDGWPFELSLPDRLRSARVAP